MMDFPDGLSALSDRYDVVLCDVWGVIHNGVRSYPDACEALTQWGRTQGPVVLISNSPRPSYDVVAQLDGLSVPRSAWQGFVTSGDATRALLEPHRGTKVWKIGPERDGPLWAGFDLTLAGPEDADFILCSGLYEDETEVPEDYRDRLTVAAGRGLPFICANPDRVVQRGDRLIFCAGALADLYESLGGKVEMAGKPYGAIYDLAMAKAAELLGRPVDRARVLCIGDGVITDVKGAHDQKLACLFVAKGIHGDMAIGPDGRLEPDAVHALLDAEAVGATHAIADLVW
ncbi:MULTISPECIES: TIGR01459 family HAD-type hydrolase [Caulobacter]|uniref:HAD-superfamily class IIA hydrolase n=1 Tax=Caulobacter vibrioides OR37 TaxID=1292034 RepID=R0D3U3_CAUVI|nr:MULTISPECIES: TIGR01459 family HAD-type hydrolase [Caulobacter]ENZ83090.1 HAD-superfamily class IIA hydrolase [Caulobacter vibrioides OR37]MBQ1562245.1 TIGR01459 family HAD-type hydrolase [Caulobacter sp.]